MGTNELVETLVAGDLSVTGDVEVGGKIVFPATQDPSAGVNVLDDYEEGTFTPAIAFGGASVGVTYTTNGGMYVKIGRSVTISFMSTLSSKGTSTGALTLSGLPFVSDDVAYNVSASSPTHHMITTNSGAIVASINADTAFLWNISFPLNGAEFQLTDNTDVQNDSDWAMSLTYQASS